MFVIRALFCCGSLLACGRRKGVVLFDRDLQVALCTVTLSTHSYSLLPEQQVHNVVARHGQNLLRLVLAADSVVPPTTCVQGLNVSPTAQHV